MNFKKIFEMQKELDTAIESNSNVVSSEVITDKLVALLVEVGEFANEYASFKYWKKNKVINQESLVEEFVDGIHFFVSLALYLGLEPEIEPEIISTSKTIQLAHTFKSISSLVDDLTKEKLKKAFGLFLGNAILLDITFQRIMEHYDNKNKINYERLKNNY